MTHRQYRTWSAPHPLMTGPEEVWETDAEVVHVMPEFHQAWLRTPDGYQLTIGDRTLGANCAALVAGQKLRCTVTRALPRVLAAEIIA